MHIGNKAKEAREEHRKVFKCSNLTTPSKYKPTVSVQDEQETGQEYFMYEKDPHVDLKEMNSKYSDNYYRDRYYVHSMNKEFLKNNSRE